MQTTNKDSGEREYNRQCKHKEILHWKECAECREFIVRQEFSQTLTEVIEKLIEEIPDKAAAIGKHRNVNTKLIKDSLRAKWLGKDNK